VKKNEAEKFTEIPTNIHKVVVLVATKKRGRPPTEYKKFEPYKIQRFSNHTTLMTRPSLT